MCLEPQGRGCGAEEMATGTTAGFEVINEVLVRLVYAVAPNVLIAVRRKDVSVRK